MVVLFLIAAFIFIELPGIKDIPDATAGEQQLEIKVTGRQFYWEYEYPNGVVAIDQMRAPAGVPVKLVVSAPDSDVIHSWWIPALGGKIDAIPGRTNETWFEADREGVYTGQCAELCGLEHARMLATVEVVSRSEFDAWLEQQRDAQNAPSAELGREEWTGVCAKCHGLAGEGGIGPRIAGTPTLTDPGRSREPGPQRQRARCPRSAPAGRTSRSSRSPSTSRRTRRVATRAESVPAWQRGRVTSWLVTTDHKRIGILYISTSIVFLILAGLMALVMRTQLAQANESLIGPERYNELVTIHGTTMVFLVGVPILAGFANYLVPLMIGAEDMAFPRLNARLVLVLRARRRRAHAQLLRRRRRGGHRLDGVRAALDPGARQRPGLLDPGAAPGDRLHRRRGDQLHRDDPQHAHARDELDAHAALRVVDRALRVADHGDHAGARRRRSRSSCSTAGSPSAAGTCRRTSSTPRAAARRCSTSTRSGSSATPRCT